MAATTPASGVKIWSVTATALALISAAVYLLTSLAAAWNFAWPQPAFDQWRLYAIYLTQPFPQSVLQLENGHRPIIPALLRVAEIEWLHANQHLQIAFGVGCALLTAGLLAWMAWRERGLPLPLRAAGVMLATVAVLWLGNARMLLHGNELVHAYLLTLSVVLGTLCMWRARQTDRLRWVILGAVCCTVATFCFGPGIATFPALAVLALALRLRARSFLVLGVGLLGCLLLYVFVLPGNGSVREMLEFRLLDSLTTTARWLASPWVNAWLGFADPPLLPWMKESRHLPVRILALSANGLNSLGLHWRSGMSAAIGFGGLAALGAYTLGRLRRWREPQRSEVVAFGVCLFAAATGVIIGIGRLHYFDQFPGQIFADRYLVWPCLFWFGLAMLGIHAVARRLPPRRVPALVTMLLLVPVMLLVTQGANSAWGAAVYRLNQRSAAAARSDVIDNEVFPDGADADRATVLDVLTLMRERKLAMFAEPGSEWLGQMLPTPPQANPVVQVQMLGTSAVADARNGEASAHFEGWVVQGIAALPRAGTLAVLDDHDLVRGFAEFSFIRPDAESLRLDLPSKRGFDGYIRHYGPSERYRLVHVSPAADRAILLGVIPPTSPIGTP